MSEYPIVWPINIGGTNKEGRCIDSLSKDELLHTLYSLVDAVEMMGITDYADDGNTRENEPSLSL